MTKISDDTKFLIGVVSYFVLSCVYWVCIYFLYFQKGESEDVKNELDGKAIEARSESRIYLTNLIFLAGSFAYGLAFYFLCSTNKRRKGVCLQQTNGEKNSVE